MQHRITVFILLILVYLSVIPPDASAQPCRIKALYGQATPVYNSDGTVNPGYYIVPGKGELYGICDTAGKMVVPSLYDMYFTISGNLTVARHFRKKLVDLWDLGTRKKIKLPGIYAGEVVGDNGLIALQFPTKKWGYVDGKGKTVIPGRFTEAEDFTNGRAFASQGEAYGIIDTKGQWIVKPARKAYKRISSSLIFIRDESGAGVLKGLLDNDGKIVVKPGDYSEFKLGEGFVEAFQEDGTGVIFNRSGRQILDGYRRVNHLSNLGDGINGRICVTAGNGFMYLLDTAGNKYLQNTYYNINALYTYEAKRHAGLYAADTRPVKLGQEQRPAYKLVREDGSVVMEGTYSDLIVINDGLFYTASGFGDARLYSLRKADGTVLAADLFTEVSGFLNQYASARKGNQWGVINLYTGAVVIPFEHVNILAFSECGIMMTRENGDKVSFTQDFKPVR